MITHLLDEKKIIEGEARYACNQAVYPKQLKYTLNYDEVTCKNCLKKLEKI